MRNTMLRAIVGKVANAVAKIQFVQDEDFAGRLVSNAIECAATYSRSNAARKIDSIYQMFVRGV